MTPTEIDNLTHRDLDAAVAEHVMGWTNVHQFCTGGVFGDEPILGGKHMATGVCVDRFSSDPAAMMKVIARLSEILFEWEGRVWCNDITAEVAHMKDVVPHCGTGSTLMEATARAALKAVAARKGRE